MAAKGGGEVAHGAAVELARKAVLLGHCRATTADASITVIVWSLCPVPMGAI